MHATAFSQKANVEYEGRFPAGSVCRLFDFRPFGVSFDKPALEPKLAVPSKCGGAAGGEAQEQ
jgi:hypothetical protein